MKAMCEADWKKITDEELELFKEEGLKWVERFGLGDWRVEFFRGKGAGGARGVRSDARAFCIWNVEARAAGIYIEEEWPAEEISENAIRRSAFHEVMHLLLGRLHNLATMRFVDCTNTIDEEVHSIVRRLESAVFNKEKMSEKDFS